MFQNVKALFASSHVDACQYSSRRKVGDGFFIYKTKQRTSQHQFVISFDFLFSSAPLLSRSTNFQQQQQRDDNLRRRRRWRERGNSFSSKKTMTKLRKTNISLLSLNKKLINFIRWIIIWRAGGMKWWNSLLWEAIRWNYLTWTADRESSVFESTAR